MDRETAYGRTACAIGSALTFTFAAAPAWAEEAAFKIDAADTAWMISATGLVLMMTIPGLALFYCGMVRKKNVLATMAQSFACTGLCSLLWFFARSSGYSCAVSAWRRPARLRRPSRNSCSCFIR
jgi:Amt family ammonium transporter